MESAAFSCNPHSDLGTEGPVLETALGFVAEFIYSKDIPLFSVILGKDSFYQKFGIQTFHVILLPYASAFSIISFYRYLISPKIFPRRKIYLFSNVYIIFLMLLIMNRAAVLIILMVMGLLLFYMKASLKKLIVIGICGLIFMYGFGYIGNKRMMSSGYQGELIILDIGDASKEFRDSKIPKEYFWGYLYSTISLSNLNEEFRKYEAHSIGNISDVFVLDILPDFVSKRVVSAEQNKYLSPDLIKEELTTTTMYGQSIKLFGVIGMLIVFVWFIVFNFLAIICVRKKYLLPLIGVLCVISGLSIFNNMLVFSGTFLQVIWIIVLPYFSIKKIKLI